jgi:branched-chain amino acid transport system ATP-binding protein
MLRVENLKADYGGISALRGVSITVTEGEIVAVIGSNGAGKTTLLKAISGLMSPSLGKIEFLGDRIDGLPPYEICQRGVIQVPGGRQLFPRMKVIHNLQLGAYLPEARKKVADSLQWVFQLFPILEERQGQKAGLLSGGEQQMLAVGRALMSLPRLLMLDDPSEGLAPLSTLEIFGILQMLGEQGTTILLVSQEVSKVLGLALRAYVLENGQIKLEGRSHELLNNDRVKESYLGM